MNDLQKQQVIQKALEFWENGQSFQAGGTIFECVPLDKRHLWAFSILNFAYPLYPPDIDIEAVLEFAEHPEKWNQRVYEAHKIVDKVNHISNPILGLATQVGKIVYTAQQFPAPFDHSAGWEIAKYLKEIVLQRNEVEFTSKAWSVLANPSFIILDEPIMCHPNCPTCLMNGLNKKA